MNESIYIDKFLNGTERFWKNLEEHCVIGCCGIEALDFSDRKIQGAGNSMNIKILLERFENLIGFLEMSSAETVISLEILNHSQSRESFILFLENIRKQLLGI